MELLSASGFRLDGRRPDQPRTLDISLGKITHNPDEIGAAHFKSGQTHVLAAVIDDTKLLTSQTAGRISVSIVWAAFAAPERSIKKSSDKKSAALKSLIQSTFEPLLGIGAAQPRRVTIQVSILSVDGSVTAACLNATTLALMRAGIALLDNIYACSVCWSDDTVLIDPTGDEETYCEAQMTIATSERAPEDIAVMILEQKVTPQSLVQMMNAAKQGIEKVVRPSLLWTIRQQACKVHVMSSVVSGRIGGRVGDA